MEVRQADLLAIKCGTSVTFECRDGRQCESVRERSYRLNRLRPDSGMRLTVSVDWKTSKVTVTGVKVEVPKKARA